MKEVTTELTLKVMFIEKVEDDQVDEYIEHDSEQDTQRRFAEAVAKVLDADKVDVVGKLKHFVMDIKEE